MIWCHILEDCDIRQRESNICLLSMFVRVNCRRKERMTTVSRTFKVSSLFFSPLSPQITTYTQRYHGLLISLSALLHISLLRRGTFAEITAFPQLTADAVGFLRGVEKYIRNQDGTAY